MHKLKKGFQAPVDSRGREALGLCEEKFEGLRGMWRRFAAVGEIDEFGQVLTDFIG